MSAPWRKDQPTPTCGNNTDLTDFCGVLTYVVNGAVARNLERRMRAAEALLKRVSLTFPGSCDSADMIDIRAHLDAARKEDGR